MNIRAVETALVEAIDQWMKAPCEHAQYHWGNAQGMARALAALRATTFNEEWELGLNHYQNQIVTGNFI